MLDDLRIALQATAFASQWRQLSERDRWLAGLLASLLATVLLYVFAWQPVMHRLEVARAEAQRQHDIYAYLQKNADAARRVEKSASVTLANDQLQGVVTSTAQQHGLVLESFDNDGSSGLVVALSHASFEQLMGWLTELQSKGAHFSEVNLDRVDNGKVDARMTIVVGEGTR